MKENVYKHEINSARNISERGFEKKSPEDIQCEIKSFFSEPVKNEEQKPKDCFQESLKKKDNIDSSTSKEVIESAEYEETSQVEPNHLLEFQRLAQKITASATLMSTLSSFFVSTMELSDEPHPYTSDIESSKIFTTDVHNSDFEKSLNEMLSEKGYAAACDDTTSSQAAKSIMIAGKMIESIGEDEDAAIESLEEGQQKAKEENETIISHNNQLSSGEGYKPPDNIQTAIDDKVKDTAKQILPESIAHTFKDGYYRTVETTEDITLYRVYGDKADKQGCYLTTQIPKDRMYTKIHSALPSEWRNSRKYYCEVVVPKGTILNIGKVKQQETTSGNTLVGGEDQILVSPEFAANQKHYREEHSLNFTGNYLDFEEKAKKIEEK